MVTVVEYRGCPECHERFPKKEMVRKLHPNMNVYIFICKKCTKNVK